MDTVRAQDGTTIAFDDHGDGPALILVDGAMSTRSSGSKPELGKLLAQRFTVYSYDRRGRGDSGDTKPYAVEREIEDIDAPIDEAGGSASLYGHSSGGCLALDATVKLGDKVTPTRPGAHIARPSFTMRCGPAVATLPKISSLFAIRSCRRSAISPDTGRNCGSTTGTRRLRGRCDNSQPQGDGRTAW